MVLDSSPADPAQLVDGGLQSDGAEHVGPAGLLPLGRIGPGHLVEVDQVNGAPTSQERVALRERGARPTKMPVPNGAYILWPLHAR